MTYDDLKLIDKVAIDKLAAEYETDLDKGVAQIAYLEGVSFEDIYSLPLSDLAKLHDKYAFLRTNPPHRLPKKFKGYKIILDFRDMETGDFVDLMEIIKAGDIDNNRHRIIAKLWQSPEPFDVRCDIVNREMSVVDAYGISGFFLEYCKNFVDNLNQYLEKQMKKMRRQLKRLT